MPERLDAVLTVIYLVFNEGYAATRGGPLVRTDLCAEAIRLGRLVRTLMAPQPPAEATALVALMLLQDARRDARLDEAGDLVVLEEQDRGRWDQRPDRRGAAAGGGGAARRRRSVRGAGGDRGGALPGGARRGYRLGADRPALRCARAAAAFADRVAESGGGGGDGGGSGGGARDSSTGWRTSWTTITCCMPRAPICCGARAGSRRRPKSYARALALVTNDSERRYLEKRAAGSGRGGMIGRRYFKLRSKKSTVICCSWRAAAPVTPCVFCG